MIRYENAPAIEATWVDENGDVVKCHAYDASQMNELRTDLGADAAEHAALIAQCEADYTPPAPANASQIRADLLAALSSEYERRMQVIAAGYPPSERESWHVQTSEARALLADAHALTPWIDGAAAARGIDRLVLAQRIAAKDDAYRAIHGALTGARQRIEDLIDAAGEDAQALQLIDVLAGWPSESSVPPESPPV
nr:hypothetical protein [Acidovorax sp. sif1233]